MKPNASFKYIGWIGGFLFLILFLVTCQKNLTESNIDSKKPSIHLKNDLLFRVKAFAARMNVNKSDRLLNRTEDPLDPSDANDLVEGTMNYNYCDASIPYWNTTVDDTTIVAPLTDSQITEEDVEEFYDNVLAFAKYRFCLIEDENKTPFAYDLEIINTAATTVTFKVTSIVGNGTTYSPFARRTFGAGDYEADILHSHCNPGSANDAPVLMKQYINYNVVYANSPDPSYYLQVQGNIGHTDENYYAFAWRFRCTGGGSCCSCRNLCSEYDLDNIYCLHQSDMNSYLGQFEYNFTHEGVWDPTGTQFMKITRMFHHRDCGDGENGTDIKDRWVFYWDYGIFTEHDNELLTLDCD